MRPLLCVLLCGLGLLPRCSGAARRQESGAARLPEGVVFEDDVAYLPPGRAEKADLYLPAKRAKNVRSPAVLIIHGGGWTGGDKGAAREFNIGTNLALNGYVGMSINYRIPCELATPLLRHHRQRHQHDVAESVILN